MKSGFKQNGFSFDANRELEEKAMQLKEIELARRSEYLRCDLISHEFEADPEFAFNAICAGWAIERARQEYFIRTNDYRLGTSQLFAS